MKKALIIILTIVLLFTIFLFVYGRFNKRQNGIVSEYYYYLDIDYTSNLEKVGNGNDRWRFEFNGIRCYLRIYNFDTGESYLQVYPYSWDSNISEDVNSSNGILCFVNYHWASDLVTMIIGSIRFEFNAPFIASVLNATSSMFLRGIGEFSIYDSFNDNLVTWVADFIIEFVHFIRVNITFMGGNLFI